MIPFRPAKGDHMQSIPLFISLLSMFIMLYKDVEKYGVFDLVVLTLSILIGVQYFIGIFVE